MAVEIPVVIDIDKAFEDAAKRVDSAIKPLQKEVNENVLNLKFEVVIPNEKLKQFSEKVRESAKGVNEDFSRISVTFDEFFNKKKLSIEDYQKALGVFKRDLRDLSHQENFDINAPQAQALQQAIIYIEQYLADYNRVVELTDQQVQKQIASNRAAEERNFIIQKEAKTISEINERISALRGKLDNLNPKDKEWTETAREINKATASLKQFTDKLDLIKTKSGSINQLNVKLSQLTEKWNAMSRSAKFDKDGNLKKGAQKIIDDYRKLTAEAQKYGMSLEQAARGAKVEQKELNYELDRGHSKLATLVKNSIRLIALHSATRFIQNVRNITAEFELQRVALGSIIQDTERANTLFTQIKKAAVESPFEIKDLVTYTKQLAAYQIETDKLFDTTMKLADISAGLGVEMNRLILAYGQVRAAAVLRGQELRQFTEAGIPLVERLAQKFTELNGRVVKTGEVFELISKRAVPFSMIEDIFNDLTSAGGSFYRMQEKQAETLLGQWNNLKDSISIMYDEIGNTRTVHSAMEAIISDSKYLMQNWKFFADVLKSVAIQFGIMKTASFFLPILTRNTKLLEKAEMAEARAKMISNDAHSSPMLKRSAESLQKYAFFTKKAALATTGFSRAWYKLRALMAGNWISMLIGAFVILTSKIYAAYNATKELDEQLDKLSSEGTIRASQSIRNFERLAKEALSAADGSKQQKDAINSLVRAYGEFLPPADKVIDKLRSMNGEYRSITDAIREKINMQIQEQKIDTVTSEFSKKIGRTQEKIKRDLKAYGFSSDEIAMVIEEIQNAVESGTINIRQSAYEQALEIEKLVKRVTGLNVTLATVVNTGFDNVATKVEETTTSVGSNLVEIAILYAQLGAKIKEVEEGMSTSTGVMGKFAKEWKSLKDDIKQEKGFVYEKGITDYEKDKSRISQSVEKYVTFIKNKFLEVGKIDISDVFSDEIPDFQKLGDAVENIVDEDYKASLRTIIADFKKDFESLVKDDNITKITEKVLMEASDKYGISIDLLRSFIKEADKDTKEYVKSIKESLDGFNNKVKEMERANLVAKEKGLSIQYDEKVIENNRKYAQSLQYLYDVLIQIVGVDEKVGKDKYLQDLRNRINDITNAYKKYIELLKYMGKDKAMENIRTFFPSLDFEPTYDEMVKKLEKMLATYSGDADATRIIEQALANVKYDKVKKSLEDNLKKLSAEIKRSEVARNFYNEILGMTGDEQFAATMTMNIYGDIGDEFKERMQKELNGLLDSLEHDTSFSVTPDIENAFKNMDFKTLLALDNLPDEIRKRLQEAYASAQKYDRDFITDLVKSYQKARTYEERIQAVRDRESKKREEIDADKAMSPEAKASYKAASEKKEQQEIADIEVERIKNMYVWTKTFEDLGNVSDQTLKQLIANLNLLIEKQGSAMSPEALKAVTQARDKAYDMVGERNPYAGIIKGLRDWGNATKKVNKLQRDGKRGTIEWLKASDEQKKAWNDAVKSASHLKDGLETLGNAVSALSELFDYDETQGVKYVLDGIAEALTLVGTALVFVNAMMDLLASNPLIIGATAIIAVITAIVKAIESIKIGEANREIEKQQRLIDSLERSYEQLEEAIKNSFGTEYVYQYNKAIENLYASADAYRKQAEAERSKGKKANKDTISDYEDKAEEAIKKTSELTKELREFFAGENLTSAAESFADAWLQAYREFGDTAGAIEERMQEMIDNLIKRSLLSEVAKNVLGNWYESLNKVTKWNAQTVAEKWKEAESLITPMVEGMKIFATELQSEGKSLRGTAGSFTGIARNIANASEESINGLAAGINTQNYYMQHIDQVVSAILLQLGGGAENSEEIASPNQYKKDVLTQLSALPQMRDDIASIQAMLDKVIKPNGVASTHRVIIS